MLLVFAPLAMQAQMTAIFGTGTTATSTGGSAGAPMSYGSAYSYSQQIYRASELTAAGITPGALITAIAFHNGTGTNTTMPNVRVYLGPRSTEYFANNSDWTPYNTLTLVDSGDWVTTGTGWIDVQLDQPYVWDGTSNLVVAVSYGGASTNTLNCGYSYTAQSNNANLRRYSTTPGVQNPESTITGSISFSANRANLRITYIMSGCPSLMPNVASVTAYTADLDWINYNQSVSYWDLAYGEAATFDTLTASVISSITDTFYTLTGLLPATNYIAKLKPHCSDGVGPWSAPRTFATSVTCPAPTNVQANNVLSDGCDLTWTAGASETNWDIYIPTGTEVPSTSTVPTASTTTTSYNVTGLLPMTEYTLYVRANCGLNDYSFWIPVTFHTACAALVTLPFTENFDSYTGSTATSVATNNLPNCWNHINAGTSTSYSGYPIIYNSSSYAASGTNAMRFYTYTTAGTYDDQMAVLPPFDPSTLPMNTMQLSFDARALSTSYTFTLVVGILTNPIDKTTFVPVDTLTLVSTAYENFEIPFNNYTGSGAYIGIMAPQPTANYNYGYVDNIMVNVLPDCVRPSHVVTSGITASSVTVSWLPGDQESMWEVAVVPQGQSISTIIPETASAYPYTVSNLTDDTPYDVYVRAICPSGGYSNWTSAVSFRTDPLCTSPRNLSISQITGSSALVSWDAALVGAVDYTMEYTEFGMNNWYPMIVSGTSALISNLIPQTRYSVRVFSNCLVSTADTVSTTFTTRCLSGGLVEIGAGTTTSSYLPSYSGSTRSYSQQIFRRGELGAAGTIDTISIQLSSVNSSANRSISIYLVHTSADAIFSWVPTTGAQLVYSGTTHWTSGWNAIPLTTPFAYNGVDNLMMVVIDNTGTSVTSPYNVYRTHSAFACSARYTTGSTYSIGSVPTATGTSLSTRNNVKFHMECDNTVTCVAPNVAPTNVTDESITVEWVPGYTESSWQLQYRAGNGSWISEGTVTSSPYTLTNLTPGTQYGVRLRSDCGGTYSDWAGFHVSTECSSVTIPYSENFNNAPGSGAGNMVPCWTRNTNSSTAYPYTNSTYNHNGAGYAVYFYGTTTYYSYVATPRFDDLVQMNNLRIKFWAYKTSAAYQIEVGIMSDPDDFGTFETLGRVSPSNTSIWEEFEVNTDLYTGTGRYIAFRMPTDITSYMYLDDVEIYEIPDCDHVDNIHAVGTPTTTSADIAWTPRGTETQWNVVYALHGTITDPSQASSTVVYTPSISLTGLTGSRFYDVYVQADCGSDTSSWAHGRFNTACDLISTLPYTEDFDSYIGGSSSNNVTPLCWNRLNTGTTAAGCPTVTTNSTYYASAPNGLYFYATTASTSADQYAILPEIDVNTLPINTLRLSFKARRYSTTTSYVNTIIVGVMTNITSASSFVPVDTVILTSTTIETHHVDFTNYTGTGSHIAIMVPKPDGTTFTSASYNYIDDVVLDVAPACTPPTSLQVYGVTTTDATVSWTAGSTETEWEMVVVQGDAPVGTGTVYHVYTNSETLYNLTHSTNYTIYVRAVCPQGGYSDYSTVSFSTQCEDLQTLPYTCNFDNVAGATTTAVSVNNLPICWNNLSGTYSSYAGYPIVYNSSTYANSGSNSMRFYTYTGTSDYGNQYAILPPIDVTLNPINTLQMTLDVRKNNTSYANFTLIVGVMTDPMSDTTFVPIDTIVHTETSYSNYTVYFGNYTGTGKYIAMYAPTHGMNGITYNTGYVDNVVVDLAPVCPPVMNVQVLSVGAGSALLTWEEGVVGAAQSFVVEYTEYNQSNWTPITGITGTSYMLAGLNPQTHYEVRVQSDCGSDVSTWENAEFTTKCLGSSDFSVGNGTTNSSYFPSYSGYKNGYSQQIFLASEMNGAQTLTSVSFEMAAVNQQRNFKIYMMHTNQSTSTSWISANNAQLCFQGAHTFTVGWNTFEFTTPFQYNGTDNLLLIVIDENSSYSSGNTYKVHTVTSGTSHLWYSDTYTYSVTSTPSGTSYSTTTYRNNVIFGVCDSNVTCAAPNMQVGNIDLTSADVTWAPGYMESMWNIEYKEASDTVWNSITGVTGSTYTIAGLNPSTHYNVRMQSDCGGGDLSPWVTEDFYTLCSDVAIPFAENFDGVAGATSTAVSVNNLPHCWNHLCGTYNSYAGYPAVYSNSTYAQSGTNALRFYTYTGTTDYGDQYAILPSIDVNTYPLNGLQLTFDCRKNSTSYNEFTLIVGVMTNPADRSTFVPVDTIVETGTAYVEQTVYFNNYTGTGSYIALKAPMHSPSTYNTGYVDNIAVNVIPTCPKPTSVSATAISTTTITLGWNDPASSSSWNIEYGPAGFTPGTGAGTTVTATSNPFTVTGLTANTYYTFYVQSDCGGGDLSLFSSGYSTRTACDAISTLPFTENFDTYGTGENAYPNCWGKINTYSANRPYVNSTHYAGVGSLYFFTGSASTYNIAITPEFDASINMNGLQAVFMYRASNNADRLIVGVMTNPLDASTFVPVDTVYPTSPVSTWVERTVYFTHYTGTGRYIAFKNEYTTTSCYAYIDDLDIRNVPTCPKPTGLAVTNSTTTSLTLSWVENGTATNWVVEYGLAGFTQGTGTTVQVQGTPSTTITGLSASTMYDFYVKTDCGGGDESPWSQVGTGNTACGVITSMPYSDGFDTYGTGTTAYPLCWSKINTYTSADRPYVNSTHYAGVGSLYFFAGSASTYNIAITPEFDSSIPINGLTATFMYRGTYTSDRLIVGVMSSTTNASTFVPVDTVYVSSSSASTWLSKTVSFANYTGNGHYIAFKNAYTTTGGYGYIDNLVISLDSSITPNTCLAPTGVTASNLQQTSATITWTAGSTETAWELQYKEASASSWSNSINVTGTPSHNPTGLTAGTQYQVRVRAVCSATETSNWSSVAAFTTTQASVTPPTVTTQPADNISFSSAALHGTVVAGSESITAQGFEWKTTTGGTYTQVNVTGTTMSYNLTGLSPTTSYTFRAFATTASGTTYGSEQTFTTLEEVLTCPAPTNLHTLDVTSTTATLTWTQEAGTAISWDVQYRVAGATSWYSQTVQMNTATIAGLTPSTTYEVNVIAHCSSDLSSEPSNTITLTTVGINDYELNNVVVYPNPTNGTVQIQNTESMIQNVEVYDAYGKLLNAVTVNDNTAALDLSGYAAGTYFVKIMMENGVVTKRVVKQ